MIVLYIYVYVYDAYYTPYYSRVYYIMLLMFYTILCYTTRCYTIPYVYNTQCIGEVDDSLETEHHLVKVSPSELSANIDASKSKINWDFE